VAKVRESSLNPIESPRGIITGQPQDKIDDFLPFARPPNGLATLAVVPLPGNQLAMPSQDRIWCEQGGDLAQQFAAEYLSLDSKTPPLIIIEQDSLLPKLLSEYFVLALEICYNLLLFTIDQAGKCYEEYLPRLQDEAHDGPDRNVEMPYHVA